MRVYIVGERGSETPIKVTTIRLCTDIYNLGKEVLRIWTEKGSRQTLEDFIKNRWGRSFNVYVNELDSPLKPKKVKKEDIWEAMQREPKLEKEITKAMLRKG